MMRALILALLALAIAAPAAQAADGPDHLPVLGAADGVRLTQGSDPQLHFSAKAAKVYRQLAGRRAISVCGAWTQQLLPDYTSERSLGVVPRKRGSIRVSTGGSPDVCAIAVPAPSSSDVNTCRIVRVEEPKFCTRVIVAITARGRTYVDRLARSVELVAADDQLTSLPPDWAPTPVELLQGAVEADVVSLDGPDASPPAGKLGLYGDGVNHTLAALLLDGTRVFLRREGDVITTNVPELLNHALTVFR
jgi:hypothetical protein